MKKNHIPKRNPLIALSFWKDKAGTLNFQITSNIKKDEFQDKDTKINMQLFAKVLQGTAIFNDKDKLSLREFCWHYSKYTEYLIND